MKTTLTIDDDIAVQIERLRRERNASLKDIVNDAMRRGRVEMLRPGERKPFRTKVIRGSRLLIDNVDNVAEVLAYAEGDDFK